MSAPCFVKYKPHPSIAHAFNIHYAHAQVLYMAGFKFNFFPDSDDVLNTSTPTTSATSTDCHSSSHPASSSPPSATSPCVSGSHYSQTISDPLSPQCSLLRGSCKLKEVLVEPFHEQLLNLVSPVSFSVKKTHTSLSPPPHTPSHLHSQTPPTVTLHHVTSELLQSLLDEERSIDSREQVLNLKSDTRSSVLSKLSSELGPLVGVADSAHSDLIPGIYEGGMKIWECTHDLIDYLSTDSIVSLSGSRVLELGCGIGLPGIFALMSGAECVHFQDYNREVLNCLTIPSVLGSVKLGRPKLNMGQTTSTGPAIIQMDEDQNVDSYISKTKFYFGDWAEFTMGHSNSGGLPYDIILTSETIYSISSQPKLLQTLKKLTNQSRGVVVMAAKTHYFGVGGSVQMFQDLVSRDGHFEMTVTRTIATAVPRMIVVLRPRCRNT